MAVSDKTVDINEEERAVFLECLKSAENGCPDDALRLSHYYDTGFGVQRCAETACKWLFHAMQQGNLEARAWVIGIQLVTLRARQSKSEVFTGLEPLDSTSTTRYKEALRPMFEGFLKSANEGCVESMMLIAQSYANGTMTQKCLKSAILWLEKAEKQNAQMQAVH